jgi:hypothetical protein
MSCDPFNIINHLRVFPHASIQEKDGKVYGIWLIGNQYKRKSPYHGAYPPTYIERVRSLLPDNNEILHLFSGSLDVDDVTFDCNPNLNPTVCGSAEEIDDYFVENSFDLVLADPPYTTADARIYGYKMPRSNVVMQKLYKIVAVGGIVVWLSTRIPMYRKEQWEFAGCVGLHTGTNRVFRSVVFLRRLP